MLKSSFIFGILFKIKKVKWKKCNTVSNDVCKYGHWPFSIFVITYNELILIFLLIKINIFTLISYNFV